MGNEIFNYTYSASQQEEIKKIREKYSAPEEQEDKMEQLRRLDRSVTKPGTVVSLIIGVVGILGVISDYPIYNAVTKRRRKRFAPEIIRLSDELMK